MNASDQHIKKIAEAIANWLRPDNYSLMEAVDRTVNEGFFSFEDIKHRILTLKHSLGEKNLRAWSERSGWKSESLKNCDVLCLHAGNLPMVGIQDLLAISICGGNYIGKLSRKDPYLLHTFTRVLEQYGVLHVTAESTDLKKLAEGKPADMLLFSGSEASSSEVIKILLDLHLISEDTPKLMRTAHFSIALIPDNHPQTMQDLAGAVFRYGGNGCRSVAIVAAPYHLDSEKCSFTDYAESFWLKNPQFQKPPESLEYRYAFNKAMDIPQAYLNDFLIEENLEYPEQKFILHWIKGDLQTVRDASEKYKSGLQSIYSTAEFIGKDIGNTRIEPLSQAQSPPIWWKPDGVDTIQWLQNQAGKSTK